MVDDEQQRERGTVSADPADFSYSVVIPVYNSQDVVGRTIDAVLEVFESAGLRHQVVLVNDGSRDGSWDVISARAAQSPHVVALDLLRNYGQHHANVAGMREATGDYVITLDDDLQNPPDQALLLIEKAMEGHDVVFGRFDRKQARGYRRLGSKAISMINRRVFDQPPGLAVSNFRILRRDVVERICGSRTAHPYITGQALMFSSDPADVLVRHDPRPVGTSNYGLRRIASLVLTILFSYSVFPLRLAAGIGFAVAGGSFLLGLFYLVRALLRGLVRARLDDDRGAAGADERLRHHAAVDAGRVRRPHAQRGQRRHHLPRGAPGVLVSGCDHRHLLVVGAQRCGTTYLSRALDAHPDVTMARPSPPEPKVFCDATLTARGAESYHRTWFAHARDETLLGDKSTSYLEDPQAPGRAAEMLGEPEVVVLLRDPVRRAVSHWRFSTANGFETRDLEDALLADLDDDDRPWDPQRSSVSPFAYLRRGRYAEQLEPWSATVPRDHARALHRGAAGRPRGADRARGGPRARPGSYAGPRRRGGQRERRASHPCSTQA